MGVVEYSENYSVAPRSAPESAKLAVKGLPLAKRQACCHQVPKEVTVLATVIEHHRKFVINTFFLLEMAALVSAPRCRIPQAHSEPHAVPAGQANVVGGVGVQHEKAVGAGGEALVVDEVLVRHATEIFYSN
jgi:hypothetical protein